MADFDVIVVGSGCAGATAAYKAASLGKSVLVIERGGFSGAKNMTGGRIYTHALAQVFPNYRDEAPLERRVAREKLSFLDTAAATTVDFSSEKMQAEAGDSYTVLRASFDQWISEQAEAAGAEYIYGIPVEHLVKDGDKVVGVSAAEDEITSEVVILADGVNSLLTSEAVGATRPLPHQMAVGVKQVIALDASTIEDRFLLNRGEGASWLFVGDCTKGHIGGGYVYTNKDSLSLGIVATISDLAGAQTPLYQMLEDFKLRADMAPLIKGGEVVEYSGHMVPEGGYSMMPELTGNGVLVAGDAAMLCLNLGYSVRGMDYAVASGAAAAEAAVKAIDAGATTKEGLSSYRQALEESFVLKDMRTFAQAPAFMESATRLYGQYPEMLAKIMESLFLVGNSPSVPLKKRMMGPVKEVGLMNVLKDVRGAMKAL